LAELAGMNLQKLQIEVSSLTDAGLAHLAGMKRLQQLYLWSATRPDECDLSGLVGLESLRTLHTSESISAAALANLARLGGLEELEFQISDLAPADVEPLERMARLRKLEIRWNEQSGDAAERKKQVPLGNALARAIGRMPSLKELSLPTPMDNDGLASLARSRTLEEISVQLLELNDDSLERLSHLSTLRSFGLGANGRISDTGLAHLANLPKLAAIGLPASVELANHRQRAVGLGPAREAGNALPG
jgi:hypothetical protein